jgi:oligopeptide transport system substrate-binding protein
MTSPETANRDPMSRAALRQMAGLALIGALGFVALMTALSWASSLTGNRPETFGAIDVDAGAISIVIRQEPPQLDSTRMQDTVSAMVIGHIVEGLTRDGPTGGVVPGVAERWDVRPEGATFWLREDARWSDGNPVTAHDFVFAWQTTVDPANASPYAFIMYVLKNAESINTGKLPRDALGVRATDDRTLEIEFENPVPYFESVAAFQTFLPIREDFYRSRNGRYAADAADMLFNGPFVMARWVHGSNIRLEKNPNYWNRDAVKLNMIDIPYITSDSSARLNLYRDGQIADVDQLSAEALDQVLEARWPLGRFSDGSVWYLAMNQRPGRLTANYHLRKAVQLANDNSELLYKVLKIPSYAPADSLFPTWLRGEQGLFRQEHPAPVVTPDIAAAREHLELARQELGLDEFPELVVLSDNSPIASKYGEYLQNRLSQTLGLRVILDRQIFKQRLEKSLNGEFDILVQGWSPDYNDPLTFGDLYASWNPNNYGRYNNPDYDAQVRIAQRSIDQRVRMTAFAEMQRLLFEDATIVTNYERGVMYVQDPRLKGVLRKQVGFEPDYTSAYLVDAP